MNRRWQALPARVLVPFSEPIADFGNRLGVALFGEWPAAVRSLMRSNPPSKVTNADADADQEVVSFVRSQMLGGLASGLLEAGATVTEDLGRPCRALDIPDDAIHDWIISPSAWLDLEMCESINWVDSAVKLVSSNLSCPSERGEPLSRLFPKSPNCITAEISILHPAAPLNFIGLDNVPTDAKIARYNTYADIVLREATAAGWRFLAIKISAGPRAIAIQDIIDAMEDYLATTGLKPEGFLSPSQKTLREVARKMLSQLATLTLNPADRSKTRVFFNSTPKDRAKPDADLFNKKNPTQNWFEVHLKLPAVFAFKSSTYKFLTNGLAKMPLFWPRGKSKGQHPLISSERCPTRPFQNDFSVSMRPAPCWVWAGLRPTNSLVRACFRP